MVGPSLHRLPGLPRRVAVYEVGPRDGLQLEEKTLSVETKLELIDRLADAGLAAIEVTSVVRPDAVPQLADADELLARLDRREGVRYPVLVPNRRGLERALAAGTAEIALFASATESFARANLNRSREESMAEFAAVAREATAAGLLLRGYISMCFGDPWEGEVAEDEVLRVASGLVEMGCSELSIGDTIGVATPGQVEELLTSLLSAGIARERIAVHFHDTYGQALANTLSALRLGIATVDASAGGLGGCPFAKSASGNLATEDLVWQLEGMGVATGIDLEALTRTSLWVAGQLGRPSPSRTVRALARRIHEH
jgi:hydroxymethylglutaryl-CoA lyase